MTNRKLDMGQAWTQTTGLIGANRDTISAIAGLFFFLPSFAAAIFVPELANPPQPAGPSGADPSVAMQALVDQMSAIYAANWPLLLGLSVVQFVGSMSLFALLTDRGHPTVGEALGTGLRSIPAYIAAQLLSAIAAGIAIGLPLGLIAAIAPPAVAALALVAGLVVILYLFIKFSLIAPVIAIEGERNPVAAIKRSWRLTKGNSFRIVLFLFLLLFTIGIISALVTGILGLVLAAFGEPVTSVGTDVVGGLVNALLTVIFLVVTVAIHRQLAGASPEALATEFE
ncbi:glycerophosphoryl diester phosphodiesterase membrane domain-containing protein [Porphyrobacter sp. ULC335]|uniref:glycerophosphoryl diester phosphodiesterase membrane domain-containing protein n=1 Tax=Porphyrobacter sp. ULC335 TaxID=2854260 RepID=UPI00221FB458|nr:glycerophosphoryl diester phosphodiesterase membrane domain-containing protein [Porphyrobacter sp. ULC335]UYV15654.1 glycerophosphoryl diester phosphodiesterase membrane domain-containing protein [Porphyrobacter sp. ULC335]